MPGVRVSKACQHCKRRKVKCDENWPTCTPCKRINYKCPGPSSLFKFVHNGKHEVADRTRWGEPGGEQPSSSAKPQDEDAATAAAAAVSDSMVMVNRLPPKKQSAAIRAQQASYGVFRLQQVPRQKLISPADKVSARLIDLIASSSRGEIRMHMTYLDDFPQRLINSACLRDCAALFCHAWIQYKRGVPAKNLLSPYLYSKAIKSLQQAINSKEVYTVETVAAMAVMERAGTMFGAGQVPDLSSQYRGIEWILTNKGPPNQDDKLDSHLSYDCQHILHTAALNGSRNYMAEKPWKDLMLNVARDSLSSPENFGYEEDSLILIETVSNLADYIYDIRRVRANPSANVELKDSLLATLRDLHERTTEMAQKTRLRALALGGIVEYPDPESIVGWSLDFTSEYMAQVYIGSMMMQLVILRMIYDLGGVYGEFDENVYAKYRGIARQMWMFPRYMAKVDPFTAGNLSGAMLLSIEAANETEKDWILDKIIVADSFLQRLPKDKKQLEAIGIAFAMHRTGRTP